MTDPNLKSALREMQSLIAVLCHHARLHGMDDEAQLELGHHEGQVAEALDLLDDVVLPRTMQPEGGIVHIPPPVPTGEARRRETATHCLWTLEASVDREVLSDEENCKKYGWDWRYMRHALQSIDLVVSLEKGVDRPAINVLRVKADDTLLVPHGVGMPWPDENVIDGKAPAAPEVQKWPLPYVTDEDGVQLPVVSKCALVRTCLEQGVPLTGGHLVALHRAGVRIVDDDPHRVLREMKGGE